ncbi:MAG: glycine--tRNA ligase [Euryarchaeota archaeon]|nr:glycine--tRNA ligase [Euryarchaeota archaeon]MDE1837583.1 glycine--tRNA ligase [Euryarchaeota archaeon]MDE1881322.1 glycine--tRNA ligase [Euryarchaeota archaeon]MDE2045894.1 glycine--tRNA ligase [Thermoplasmata archaeon]
MQFEELLSLFKRRGVLWPSAEIYGGTAGLYDYGPAGTALKRRLEAAWSSWFVGLSPNYHLIDPAEIVPEAVVRSSGHLAHFADPDVTCGKCGQHFRADTLLEENGVADVEGLAPEVLGRMLQEKNLPCPRCGERALSLPRAFNLMFGLDFGAAGKERAYLRPETAQGAYLSFSRMWEVGRNQLPLGIAVIGKAYRNEIAPRNVLFRMRAFTQAELQIFFDPENFSVPLDEVAGEELPCLRAKDREKGATEPTPIRAGELVSSGGIPSFYAYHLAMMLRFFRDVLQYPADRVRFLEKNEKERAFYNRIHFDAEVRLDSLGGYKELGAVHYRGDYDLSRHGEGSKTDLRVTPTGGKTVLPHVLELTFGVDRNLWALGDLHLRVETPAAASGGAAEGGQEEKEPRTVWALPPYLAPMQIAVLPLIRKVHAAKADEVAERLRREDGFTVVVPLTASVGKRYAREDELATPFAVTIDNQTMQDGTITLRERDSRAQVRLPLEALAGRVRSKFVPPRPTFRA